MSKGAAIREIEIAAIEVLNPRERNQKVFQELVESIRLLGLKKPITVAERSGPGGPRHVLVCGQGRMEAFLALGQTAIPAQVIEATDEEAFVMSLVENIARHTPRTLELLETIRSLKKRGHSTAAISRKTGLEARWVAGMLDLLEKGEHRLLTAVEAGRVPLATAIAIARAGSDDSQIQEVMQSAYEMLKDRNFSGDVMRMLKKMKPQRQIECADLMCSMNNFSVNYAGALLAATPPDQLAEANQPKRFKGLAAAEISRMEQEMSLVQSRFKLIEQSYGTDMLNMVLARGYLSKLLANRAVASYLQRRQPDLLEEFRSIVKITSLDEEGEATKVA